MSTSRQQLDTANICPLVRGDVATYLWRWAALLPHSRGFMAA